VSFRKSTRITFKSTNSDGSHSYVLDYDLPDGSHRSEVATVSKPMLDDGGSGEPTTQLADDVPARAKLVKVLEDFDKAGHLLQKLPNAMRPVHVQYMAKDSDGRHRYLILVSLADGQQSKYVFRVSEEEGHPVSYPDDLATILGSNTDLSEPLIDAIRHLYLACSPA
jgi:hypothetical protein